MARYARWGATFGALSLLGVATAAYLSSASGPLPPGVIVGGGGGSSTTPDLGEALPPTLAPRGGGGGVATGPGSEREEQRGAYIVVFNEPALASYKGSMPGYPRPERYRDEQGTLRLDVDGRNSERYVDFLESRQAQMEARMSIMVGRDLTPRTTMQHALNGMVVDLSEREARSLRNMSDVRLVEAYKEFALDTDTGPALIGAPPVWDGSIPGAPGPYRGEGVVVGIIDSGINFGSPSFAAVGPVDGYVHSNPLGSGNYLGTCAPGGVDAGRCNDKLIGGYDFVCGAPENACTAADSREEPGFGDTNGHGSHTASTAAGNLRDAVFSGNTLRISGVAPHANIIAYDVCYTQISTGRGLCGNTSTTAAVNQAVADGIVDVLNYSISGGTSPWTESTSLAFLGAVDAGIFVAASAGNSGPGPNTMGHHEPWVSSTAAANHGRGGFGIAMSVTGPAPVPANLAPIIVNQGSGGVTFNATIPGTTPLFISSGINTASDGCAAYPANTFAGGIAVVRRGTCSFAIKVNNAAAAGAVAVIIANNAAGVILPSVPGTTVPVFSVTQAEGDALRNFGQANPSTTTAQITYPAIPLPNVPDALAAFSSRGPAGTFNILKPDITAPGVDVLAVTAGTALTGSENIVGLLSGTSMASPHQAGAAALIRQARPTWTPPEIKSALALTAAQTVLLEDTITPANPFARGSGRVQVDRAINAGLVMNETLANYQAGNPAIGGDPTTLNQPNLYNRSCSPTCTFYRTFRNTRATSATWRVQLQGVSGAVPSFITVPGNGTLRVKFTIYGFGLLPNGATQFGTVVLTPATGTAPVLRMPVGIAVQPPVLTVPSSVSVSAPVDGVGSVYFPLANTGGSNLTYSFISTGTASQRLVDATSQGIASGFRSTTYTDPATAGSQAQYSADDFVLTQNTQITAVASQGFVVSGTALTSSATNLTFSIYPDAGGLPAGNPQTNAAAALWTYTTTPTGPGVTVIGSSDIQLNLAAAGQNVNLPPGRYWLLINTRGTFANRFAWYGSNTQSGNSGFASITVATNGTGSWTANPSFPGLTMRIIGNVPCGAPWISGTYASSGTLAPGASVQAMTVVYGTGLTAGSYRGNVCVTSNDPQLPSLAVPVLFTVTP